MGGGINQLSRPKGPVWVGAGSPCWDRLGIFYLLIFCPADSLFSEDDQASVQTGRKSWQEAGKNCNQTDFCKSLQISCDLARADRRRDNTCQWSVMPSLSAPANL